ncbi:hypothetical protein ELQ92_09170 [Labedella populi]|uniref:DUF6993 domain-containing protein n=1 Tax=Labedella populi TaxID=2498850 RepID=A0A444QAS8_9MICO|nr:hypothetical protein [Labedella populi]RWZ61188.1 hypothetical protein ELQ92_09170 [Labedella populi]
MRSGAVRVLVGLAITVSLAGCTQAPTDDPTSAAPEPTRTAPAPAVTLLPDASAEENKPFFDQVNAATAENPDAGGRDFIDALVAAGFDKATMEVTKDATTLGARAESIQFSVRWSDGCLIGQFGPAVDGYHSTVQPVLGGDRCLIGETRAIDW